MKNHNDWLYLDSLNDEKNKYIFMGGAPDKYDFQYGNEFKKEKTSLIKRFLCKFGLHTYIRHGYRGYREGEILFGTFCCICKKEKTNDN